MMSDRGNFAPIPRCGTIKTLMGLLWALWHLPLLLNNDNVMSTYPKGLFLIEMLASTIIYAWLFNSTRGSVLILIIYHTFVNTFGALLNPGRVAQTAVTVFVTILIVLVCGAANLSRHRKQSAVVCLTDHQHLPGGG